MHQSTVLLVLSAVAVALPTPHTDTLQTRDAFAIPHLTDIINQVYPPSWGFEPKKDNAKGVDASQVYLPDWRFASKSDTAGQHISPGMSHGFAYENGVARGGAEQIYPPSMQGIPRSAIAFGAGQVYSPAKNGIPFLDVVPAETSVFSANQIYPPSMQGMPRDAAAYGADQVYPEAKYAPTINKAGSRRVSPNLVSSSADGDQLYFDFAKGYY